MNIKHEISQSTENDFLSFVVEQTTSTMDLAKEILKSAQVDSQSVFAVFAKQQTQGRGRGGSQWLQATTREVETNSLESVTPPPVSSPNSQPILPKPVSFQDALLQEIEFLPFTLAVPASRLKIQPGWLSIAVGCAVVDALHSTAQFVQSTFLQLPFVPGALSNEKDACLKWPNDIVYLGHDNEFRKMCGILCESSSKGAAFGNFFIGIGLNFFATPEIDGAGSFFKWLVQQSQTRKAGKSEINRFLANSQSRAIVLHRFLTHLQNELAEYLLVYRSTGQLRGLALQRSLPLGTYLRVNKGLQAGRFAGLSETGGLLLEGSSEPILAGDVAVLPAPADQFHKISRFTSPKSASFGNAPRAGVPPFGSAAPRTGAAVQPEPLDVGRVVVALDLGNTRLHWGCRIGDTFKTQGDIAYAVLLENETLALRSAVRALLEILNSHKKSEITLATVSVIDAARTRASLSALEKMLTGFFPEMKFLRREFTSAEILNLAGLEKQYLSEQLGTDRALRFYFACQEARLKRTPVAVVSFGTAITCECVSAQGAILESVIAPGLQMGLDALHSHTARLPQLNFSPENATEEIEQWDTSHSMHHGVMLASVGLLNSVCVQHSVSHLVVTGGNAQEVAHFISESKLLPGTVVVSVDQALETRTLSELARKLGTSNAFLPSVAPPSSGSVLTAAVSQPARNASGAFPEAVLRSMLKARLLKRGSKDRVSDAPEMKLEDFRRLGGRMENVGLDERLDKFLADHFKFHTRDVWRERILAGEVRIEYNSPRSPEERRLKSEIAEVKATYRLKAFDQIWLYQPPEYEPDSLDTCDVVFDDADTVVFSKPGNLVIHAAGLYGKNTFIALAQKMGYGDAAPVHRIDRETSGILVCARKAQTRKELSEAFREGQIQKMYIAMTRGVRPLPEYFRTDLPIGDPVSSKIRLKLWVNGKTGQPSLTYFAHLASHGDFHLIACLPQTGRTNQIRVHLAAIGHWIIGDKMYHPNEEVFIDFYENGFTEYVSEQVLFPRHLLHNTGIAGPASLGAGIGLKPVVCPFTSDMMHFVAFADLVEKAQLGATAEEQTVQLGALFSRLSARDFESTPLLIPENI